MGIAQKNNTGILDDFQTRQFIKDPQFTASMNEDETNDLCSFVQVVS